MIAAPSLSLQLETAAGHFNDAKVHHLGAVVAHAETKRALELAQARMLCHGVEGKNTEQRQAVMRLELDALHNALTTAEGALAEARCSLECAQLDWDLARYMVRALEATVPANAA